MKLALIVNLNRQARELSKCLGRGRVKTKLKLLRARVCKVNVLDYIGLDEVSEGSYESMLLECKLDQERSGFESGLEGRTSSGVTRPTTL